jgi:hypothetical protein
MITAGLRAPGTVTNTVTFQGETRNHLSGMHRERLEAPPGLNWGWRFSRPTGQTRAGRKPLFSGPFFVVCWVGLGGT